MTQTVRLLATYNGNRPGTIVTVDNATAAELLRGNATVDLTGGTYPDLRPAVEMYYDPATTYTAPPGKREPSYPRRPGSMYLTGREASLAPFPFASVYADGQVYSAETINASHAGGIAGVLERFNDAGTLTRSTASAVPADQLYSWLLRCQPAHKVMEGRPRTQIVGRNVNLFRRHRMSMKIRLYHDPARAAGYFDIGQKMPLSALWVLSQQGGNPPFNIDTGQDASGGSPVYLMQQGGALYWEVRTPADEMGYAPGDPGESQGLGYTRYSAGDAESIIRSSEIRILSGRNYHRIVLDFFLDDRPSSEEGGGQGYFEAYFDGEFWFRHSGPTSLPRNAAGNLIPIHPRIGYYEISGAVSPANTLNSAVNAPNGATSVERSLVINQYSCLEAQ